MGVFEEKYNLRFLRFSGTTDDEFHLSCLRMKAALSREIIS